MAQTYSSPLAIRIRMVALGSILLFLLVGSLSCTSGRQSSDEIESVRTASASGQTRVGAPSQNLSVALDGAVLGKWRYLRILDESRDARGLRSVEIYGSGIGIWQGKSQFSLSRHRILLVLKALQDADFPGMRNVYGGKKASRPPKRNFAIRVTHRLVLEIDGITKQVTQVQRGKQSKEFKALAEQVLELCEEPARSGLPASSLGDGLQQVARGNLAAETLHILINRDPEARVGDKAGWILRIDGPRVTLQAATPTKGYGKAIFLELSRKEVADLARQLVHLGIAGLPINLYDEHYTDLSVKVLNWNQRIQARRFAGMKAEARSDSQQRFARIYDLFQALHLRVLKQG